jgi:serine/threonine protein phosphatase PrpC
MAASGTDVLTDMERMDRGTEGVGTSITWHSLTHPGSCFKNDDAHCVEVEADGEATSRYLLTVADGLGGCRRGDIASQIAIKTITKEFHNWHGRSADRFVGRAVLSANQEVYDTPYVNYGLIHVETTVTAVAVEQDTMAIGHVGDCRLYRVRGGQAKLLTRDHSFAADMLRLHLITPEQVRQHPERNRLTRTVGSSPLLHVDVIRERIIPNDVFVLCSDGLWSEVAEDTMKNAVQDVDTTSACEKLVELALKGEACDNITVIVFRIVRVGRRTSPSWRCLLRR